MRAGLAPHPGKSTSWQDLGALVVLSVAFAVVAAGARVLLQNLAALHPPDLVVEAPLAGVAAWLHTAWRRERARRRARARAEAVDGPDFRAIVGAFAAASRESLDVQANTQAFMDAVTEALGPTHQLVVVKREGVLQAIGTRGVEDVTGHLRRGPTPEELSIPLKVGERLVGRLLLGPRASGIDYGAEDLALLDSLGQSLALSLRNAELFAELAGQERLRRELEIACDVQMGLLPKAEPAIPGALLAASCLPAAEVGGDLYDFVQIDATRWGILVGDVAGKGVPASLMMAVTLTLFRAIAPGIPSPASTLGRLNKLVNRNRPSTKAFVAAVYMIYDARDGSVIVANAGHPPPLVDGHPVPVKGLPLGINPKVIYKEVRFTLSPGSSVVIYSDGLEDLENEGGEAFGHVRVGQLFSRLAALDPREALESLRREAAAYAGRAEPPDDRTVAILRREARGLRPTPPPLAEVTPTPAPLEAGVPSAPAPSGPADPGAPAS